MRFYTSAEVSAFTGISADRLRDWRRRDFLDGIGACRVHGADEWTSNAKDPRLTGSEPWGYRLADITALFLGREIADCGLALRLSLQVAQKISPVVNDWAFALKHDVERPDARYFITYPVLGEGKDSTSFIPLYGINMEVLKELGRPATFLIDCMEMAKILPEKISSIVEA